MNDNQLYEQYLAGEISLTEANTNINEAVSDNTPYGVVDNKTGEVIYSTTYKNRNRARVVADKRDAKYGATRFTPKVLKEDLSPYTLMEAGIEALTEKGLTLDQTLRELKKRHGGKVTKSTLPGFKKSGSSGISKNMQYDFKYAKTPSEGGPGRKTRFDLSIGGKSVMHGAEENAVDKFLNAYGTFSKEMRKKLYGF